jgi:NTE family protein
VVEALAHALGSSPQDAPYLHKTDRGKWSLFRSHSVLRHADQAAPVALGQSMTIARRQIAAAAAAALAATPLLAQAAPAAVQPAETPALESDGLAVPIPMRNPPGAGKARGIALCGGGEYLLAWYMGYFRALSEGGVELSLADVIVGTSAGSVAGAAILAGELRRMHAAMDFFGKMPGLLLKLADTTHLAPSQQRAVDLALSVKDASTETIQAIGRAAMAAHNPAGGAKYAQTIRLLVGQSKWPSPGLYTTANDCYTGERLIVSEAAGIDVNEACAASASWPGRAGPAWLKDRYAMDGGVCQTSTHCDVIAGVKKAIVISLSDGSAAAAAQGLRLSSMPNTLPDEIASLKAGGTEVKLIVVGLPPGWKQVELLNPKSIKPALDYGYARGKAEAREIRQFWA